ncbi:serine/threonine-protein kinase STY8-like isoform X2 [Carya illinoinensis]|uniref:serine/threonine-protein kinase STY8-like isoform X2 n=1 Tax=Carya illinoinensis TaxID=32201 RepID=UPI001C71FDEF|nr:serine/threonine-protein kinase STY8-like isoform X2 [Carya illinoinensis]
MEKNSDGFVRADQIDLKSLDEHLDRAWTMDKNKKKEEHETFNRSSSNSVAVNIISTAGTMKKERPEWEIDPAKLVIKAVIARGTFGTVHRGIYDGQDVAVKLLDWGEEGHRTDAEIASLRAAFTQEVAVWHKLDHPNVTKSFLKEVVKKCLSYLILFLELISIEVTDMESAAEGNISGEMIPWELSTMIAKTIFIGATMGSSELQIQTDNGQMSMPSSICCVVVEYLPGGALKSYLIKNRRRKLAFKVVIQIALDLARGLSYLHSEKIVHRDVKTENMLLDKTRTVKIADFGVARVEASNPNDMTGETGTLGYMAPEVLNGNPYNRKCDVYSFGICLWEVYCCDMPYPDLSFAEVTSAVVRQNLRPEIPRCCPSSLANVMKRCWDANPDKRPEMAEVVSMLEAIDTSKGGGMIPLDQPQGCICFRKHRGP